MSRKILCLILSFAMIISVLSASALAAEPSQPNTQSSTQIESIISVLQFVENDKAQFGLAEISFEELYIGNEIHAYEYAESGFNEIYRAFPLFHNDTLVALAVETDGEHYQIITSLADDISVSNVSAISIIYDVHACYLFNGTEFILVKQTPEEALPRLNLSNEYEPIDTSALELCELSEYEKLGYYSAPMTRAGTYYSCPVDYVTQLPYENICWAATIACISNYVRGTSLTAVQVAITQHGSDFDYPLTDTSAEMLMEYSFNLDYTFRNQVPSNAVLLENLLSGYPIYGIFVRSGAALAHAVTICGINVSGGYIVVMNPQYGISTGYASNGTYSFVSEYSGNTLTLARAICHSW